MNSVKVILAALALLSFGLLLWQWLAARRFSLHRRVTKNASAPAVTLLKPLKGCDETTAASLASWLRQDYAGPVQILFGVADGGDPVCKIVTELMARNSGCDAQLVICDKLEGGNAKVAKLAQLEGLAKHELILVSDADVRVPPDFLTNIVAHFAAGGRSGRGGGQGIGLVNCFYRLANPSTPAMHWEAVAMNADFWSQVLQAATLKPMDFALGAAMLTSRKVLEKIGGFESLVDCLADDYQLGHRIAAHGYGIVLCPVVVECWEAPKGWLGVWQHQLRWARTIRVCEPVEYFFSILSNAGFWALLWLAASLIAYHGLCAPLMALALLLARIVAGQNLQRRLTPGRKLVSPFWMVPVKDVMQASLWFCAFTGNTIEWRGRRMNLRRDGTLIEQV